MKILFKNTTTYNKEIYNEFLNFYNKKYHFLYTLYTALVIAIFLFCLGVQVKAHNYTLAIIFCCTLTVFFLWRYLHPFSIVKNELKSDKIVEHKKFSFVFYEKKFKTRDNINYSVNKYYKLHRVFETEDFFYLYMDKIHALVLDKNGFTIGTPEDFSLFIKKKCKFKYKKINIEQKH